MLLNALARVVSFLGIFGALGGFCAGQYLQPIVLNATFANSMSAKCLDGTPGAYYFGAPTGSNNTKWVIMLEYGPYCSEPTCPNYAGIDGYYNSSNGWSEIYNELGSTVIRSSQSINPDFNTWNRVLIHTCSGDLFLGTRTSAGAETGGKWFSGFHIIEAVLAELISSRALGSATEIIWSGESGGAVGAVSTVDYVAARFPQARVTLLSNAGLLTEERVWPGSNKENRLPRAFQLWNPRIPTACANAVGAQNLTSCLYGDVGPLYVTVPSFFVDSISNVYLLGQEIGFNDSVLMANLGASFGFLTEFYQSRVQKFRRSIFNQPNRGYWITSALVNIAYETDNCTSTGLNWIQMFGNWYFGRSGLQKFFDECGASQALNNAISDLQNTCPLMRTCVPDGSSLPAPAAPPQIKPPVAAPVAIKVPAIVTTSPSSTSTTLSVGVSSAVLAAVASIWLSLHQYLRN